MLIIEFTPRPYGDIDIAIAAKNIFTMADYIKKIFPSIQPMYTGMRGPDSFFEIECEDLEALKTHISSHNLVTNLESTPITIPFPINKTYDEGLRVFLVIPKRERRRFK